MNNSLLAAHSLCITIVKALNRYDDLRQFYDKIFGEFDKGSPLHKHYTPEFCNCGLAHDAAGVIWPRVVHYCVYLMGLIMVLLPVVGFLAD